MQIRTTKSFNTLHLVGGIRCVEEVTGFRLGPVQQVAGGPPGWRSQCSRNDILLLAQQHGLRIVGVETNELEDEFDLYRYWQFLPRQRPLSEVPISHWQNIAIAADAANDAPYAKAARSLAFSLNGASIRLRDISAEYARQLSAAIAGGTRPGNIFSNLAVIDLQLAVHSCAVEMCAARDYLATIAALEAGLQRRKGPAKSPTFEPVDSLKELRSALKDQDHATRRNHKTCELLLQAACRGDDSCPRGGWLYQLGETRNRFVHRSPIGARDDEIGIRLREVPSHLGTILTVTHWIEGFDGTGASADALATMAEWFESLCALAAECAALLRHTPKSLSFSVDGDGNLVPNGTRVT